MPEQRSAFDMLASGVQRQLWSMGWTDLRPLQVGAIKQILSSSDHVILSAATAAGKTEAAFLPVLSRIAEEPRDSVQAIYVGPLKALINDQFSRVEELCAYLEVPVHRWHGDVDATAKIKLIRNPHGVLLITPESLESLFVNRSTYLRSLFAGLRFVVIDEVHSFLDNERGLHLRSLLSRLRAYTGSPISVPPGNLMQLIGLSATIGEPEIAKRYLDPDHPERVKLILGNEPDRELKLRLYAYQDTAVVDRDDDQADEEAAIPPPTQGSEPATDNDSGADDEADAAGNDLAQDLVRHCRGHANLIFANRKSDVEYFADLCKQIGTSQSLPDRFLVHHGSLSAEIRQDAEEIMKSGAPATTFCSSTLEMGIDIGSVHMVGQIGTPNAVASLKQRLGRSGRKEGTPRILRMYEHCRNPGAEADIFERLQLPLIQSIAVTELLLAGWVEPPVAPACDLSTLMQQVISVIAERGAARADELYRTLCSDGVFRDIAPSLFATLLRRLAARDVLEQTPEGELILGLVGERLRKEKGFYAVFKTPEEYAVLHNGRRIGHLELVPEKDQHLLLAGQRWRVVNVDHERRELHVRPARGRKPPRFAGGGGEVHPKIRQKMRAILRGVEQYTYLDSRATRILHEARQSAVGSGICERSIFVLGPRDTALMTWTGTRIQQTMIAMFEQAGAEPRSKTIGLIFSMAPQRLRSVIESCAATSPDELALARRCQPRLRRKYDEYLDDSLLDTCIAQGSLDVSGALEVLRSALRECEEAGT